MSLARLDHLIYDVPDIEAAHRELVGSYPEAWPIGRFWPSGRTSGVALGGINLELMQPDDGAPQAPAGMTLAFEPVSLDAAASALSAAGLSAKVFDKFESDPNLLKLRGFSGAQTELICRNLVPEGELPFDFFICDYSPFLKEWLSPRHPRLHTSHHVVALEYGCPDPDGASRLLSSLGYAGSVEIRFVSNAERRILRVEMDSGALAFG